METKYIYDIEVKESRSISFEPFPIGRTHIYYYPKVYKEEEYITWYRKKKIRHVLVWEGSGDMHRASAEMSAKAIIDILSCADHSQVNGMLIEKWGYHSMNSKADWSDLHPEFYEDDFEPFYSQWKAEHPEYVREETIANGMTIKFINHKEYDKKGGNTEQQFNN